ncbi:MAG: hypothetical protein ABR501_09230 [Pyrinomonadaceae bacterium]
MSTPKPAKIGVQISKETGGAFADLREVIESEIARIQDEYKQKTQANIEIGQANTTTVTVNGNGNLSTPQ